jgi:hypothetical protein
VPQQFLGEVNGLYSDAVASFLVLRLVLGLLGEVEQYSAPLDPIGILQLRDVYGCAIVLLLFLCCQAFTVSLM